MYFIIVCLSFGLGLVYAATVEGNFFDVLGVATLLLCVATGVMYAIRRGRNNRPLPAIVIVSLSTVTGMMIIWIFDPHGQLVILLLSLMLAAVLVVDRRFRSVTDAADDSNTPS